MFGPNVADKAGPAINKTWDVWNIIPQPSAHTFVNMLSSFMHGLGTISTTERILTHYA